MKDLFPGYFKESEENLKEVWDACLFVFDANILLNLYRYSDTTRREFLRILEKIKDRVWLPHRAAEEYLKNRLTVIDQQERSYDETIKSINSLKSDLDNARQHPFVNRKVMTRVDQVFKSLCDELLKNKEIHSKRIYDDEIKESIATLFENNIGKDYSKEKLEQLILEGEERYKQKIPPGFRDGSKLGDSEIFSEKCRKFGDLIVWNQVIDKSIEAGLDIVFVTDDKKEDWWEKFKGKTVGPRPELVKEFKDRTNNTYHMYQADRFLELARENLDEQVSEEIVEEIREVRRRDKLAYRRMKELEYHARRKSEVANLIKELEHTQNQMASYEEERRRLQEKLNMLDLKRREIRKHKDLILSDSNRDMEIDPIMRHYSAVQDEYNQVLMNIERLSMMHEEMKHRLMASEQDIARHMRIIEQENSADSQTRR